MDEQSLSHTKWKCQYHIVIVPKYRRKVVYGKLRADIGKILRKLCEYKHVEIIEAHAMLDHIHMLLSIPPKLSVGEFMGYLKGKSTLMIFERHANLKYKYGRRVAPDFRCFDRITFVFPQSQRHKNLVAPSSAFSARSRTISFPKR